MVSSTRGDEGRSWSPRARVRACAALVAGICFVCPTVAHAQTAAAAQAEVLFTEGKKLLDNNSYDQACPKLEASHRLDPATGTLLALAFCHEQQGKTASAWVEYREAAGRAKAEGRMDRHQAAIDRASALEARLSRVKLEVSSETAGLSGLEVKRDGQLIDREAWGSELPVDPGEHLFEARAQGKQTWSAKVVVGSEGDVKLVTVPPLRGGNPEPATASDPALPVGSNAVRVEGVDADRGAQSTGSSKTTAYVVGVVGLVAMGAGTYFGLKAMSKNGDSEEFCEGNRCHPDGAELRNDALDAAKYSTIGFAAGGALVAGAVGLFLMSDEAPSESASVRTYPIVTTGSVGWSAGGTF